MEKRSPNCLTSLCRSTSHALDRALKTTLGRPLQKSSAQHFTNLHNAHGDVHHCHTWCNRCSKAEWNQVQFCGPHLDHNIPSAKNSPCIFEKRFYRLTDAMISVYYAFLMFVYDEVRRWYLRKYPEGFIYRETYF